jgi:hypothetical protein
MNETSFFAGMLTETTFDVVVFFATRCVHISHMKKKENCFHASPIFDLPFIILYMVLLSIALSYILMLKINFDFLNSP